MLHTIQLAEQRQRRCCSSPNVPISMEFKILKDWKAFWSGSDGIPVPLPVPASGSGCGGTHRYYVASKNRLRADVLPNSIDIRMIDGFIIQKLKLKKKKICILWNLILDIKLCSSDFQSYCYLLFGPCVYVVLMLFLLLLLLYCMQFREHNLILIIIL